MESTDLQIPSRTLTQSGLPVRVAKLCEGLLKINSDFFEQNLQKLLNDFESILFKNTENPYINETHAEHYSHLRNLKRTRHDFIPKFLAGIEAQLAGIRSSTGTSDGTTGQSKPMHRGNLHLQDHDAFDAENVQFEISSRCESQNSFEIFLLGQRFGVLAGQPSFDAVKLPLGPRMLCRCLQESVDCLDLDAMNTRQIYFLFERYVFSNFSMLMDACNSYLISNGVLPNLSYVPFRNPELRHKKSPMALSGVTSADMAEKPAPAEVDDSTVVPFKPLQTQAPEPVLPANIEEGFAQLRNLLAKRKQLLNKLGSFSDTYLGDTGKSAGGERRATDAPHEVLKNILKDFQHNAISHPNASIQHLKHDLLAQLRNQSGDGQELTLNEEDSDAIDLVGLVMDDALKDVSPTSVASQLLSMMQPPLMQVVLNDKTFFSDRVHPARQVLNIIAETGFNWLDENGNEDALHEDISSIISRTVRDFDGDNQQLIAAYRETNELLQAMVRKAEAAEKRQIEAARGKERLNIARNHAAQTMAELTRERDISPDTLNLLNKAWTDVMALTELRQGSESSDWNEQKTIAERIIAANGPDADEVKRAGVSALKDKIQTSLGLVGYHADEAASIADCLISGQAGINGNLQIQIPEKTRFGENTRSANVPVYELDERQQELVEQIKTIPVGTWLEFLMADNPKPVRRKLAWQSHVTNNVLFVNQRGQRTSEMMIEELAVEISEGRARIQQEDKRNVIERAFENVLSSLRGLLPGRTGSSKK
jgi:hypothetical protein